MLIAVAHGRDHCVISATKIPAPMGRRGRRVQRGRECCLHGAEGARGVGRAASVACEWAAEQPGRRWAGASPSAIFRGLWVALRAICPTPASPPSRPIADPPAACATLRNPGPPCPRSDMPVTDEQAARTAIATLQGLSAEQRAAQQAIEAIRNDEHPFVDVHQLFAHYNVLYFRKLLLPRVEVLWSPRLTLCAGICELLKDDATGKLSRIRLKLSTPLLQYRPRSDTIDTLLHEAIHAYFFVIISWRHARDDDGSGHGVGFQLLANAINEHGNYNVTIYHTFHDEVDSFRTHVWQCDGPCRALPPDFGLVKRSMNRPPGKSDIWWPIHQVECGGTFIKIKEPAPTKRQLDTMSARERAGRQKNKLDAWITASPKKSSPESGKISNQLTNANGQSKPSVKPADSSKKASTTSIKDLILKNASPLNPEAGRKRSRADEDEAQLPIEKKLLVECPICPVRIAESDINEHLDIMHPP